MEEIIRRSLDEMLDSISEIEQNIQGVAFDDYRNDRKRKITIANNFETIFEALERIPYDFKIKYQQVPWTELEDLRQKIAGSGYGIDERQLWDAAKNNLMKAKKALSELA